MVFSEMSRPLLNVLPGHLLQKCSEDKLKDNDRIAPLSGQKFDLSNSVSMDVDL